MDEGFWRKMRRYDEYRYNLWEIMGVILLYLVILALVAYFFFKSLVFFFISLISIPIYIKLHKQEMIRRTKTRLAEEFAEVLNSVNANVKAGYATENAFVEAAKDIKLFFGEKSLMAAELMQIKKGLSLNQTLESQLLNLGKRSGVEDIIVFAKVFETAKRNGGNIREVLEKTSETVRAKIEVEKQINVLISQKKMELRIMECIPFFIIAYIDITSRGYFNVLYHNLKGVIMMTVCLIIYAFASYLGSRMVNIDV